MPAKVNDSLGDLVTQATHQLSDLVRKEVELAKAELTREIAKVGRGAGMFGGAGFTGYLALLFGSLALMFGLGELLPLWVAALVVTALYAVATVVLVAGGRATLGSVSPVPDRTIRTLKEDAEWARRPNS